MKLKISKKAVGITLLVIGILLFSVSGTFAYGSVKQITSPSNLSGDDGDITWDNFTIPPSTSIGPVGSILISGASGVFGVVCIVHGRRKFTT